jgi:hypothetical protein
MAKKKYFDEKEVQAAAFQQQQIINEIDQEIISELLKVAEREDETAAAPVTVVKPKPFLATWEQIKDKLHSVSAMKSELTGQRITHGDAIAIFKTDAHRKLYEEWAAFKRAQV